MSEANDSLAERARALAHRAQHSRFTQDVFAPKVAQPLSRWLDDNFGETTTSQSPPEVPAVPDDEPAAQPAPELTETADATQEAATQELATQELATEELDLKLRSPGDTLGFVKALGQRIKNHNLVVVAAGIAFWGLLAIPATLFAVVSIAGLVLDPDTVKQQVNDNLSGLPEEARTIIGDQLEGVSSGSTGGLIVGVVMGLLLALWTSSGAMAKLMAALNTIYGVIETRKFAALRGTALALTFGGIVFISAAVFLLAALPPILSSIDGVGDSLATASNWLRFPVLGLVMVLGLGVLYHVGPNRSTRYRPLTMGAAVAMFLWLALSGLFTIYTATVGNYNETYGSIGGIVILLLWLFITAFVVLLGAEIHAEGEATSD